MDPWRCGLVPRPCWCSIIGRVRSFAGVIICLLAMAMMAYSLSSDALNQWLTQLAKPSSYR